MLWSGSNINSAMGQGLDGLYRFCRDQTFLPQCQVWTSSLLFLIFNRRISAPSLLSQLTIACRYWNRFRGIFCTSATNEKEEDDFVAPRGAPISGKINKPMDGITDPVFDSEFDYGFLPNFQEGGLVNLGDSMDA